METPNKIYINPNIENRTWLIGKGDTCFVEYIRADVLENLIIKSAVWFANRCQANGSYLCANDTDDYVQEMKEYLKQKWL